MIVVLPPYEGGLAGGGRVLGNSIALKGGAIFMEFKKTFLLGEDKMDGLIFGFGVLFVILFIALCFWIFKLRDKVRRYEGAGAGSDDGGYTSNRKQRPK